MDDADPLSTTEVARMVRAIEPDWTVRDATPAPEGTDAVYFVTAATPDGSRECVLKACDFVDPAEFRPEPYVLGLLDRRTSVPVPAVVGAVDEAGDLPAPFFLMERCDGTVMENGAGELPVAVLERVARDAGRYLGEVHALGSFDRFGPVRLAGDLGAGPADDPDRLYVPADEGRDAWEGNAADTLAFSLDRLHERFADLESDLRALVRRRAAAVDSTVEPVFGNGDYRLGNLLIDPDTGETRAVLDWGNVGTVDPLFNLVLLEEYLADWRPLDDARRLRVRAAILEGYEATNSLPNLDDGERERRRALHHALARVFPLAWFSLWYGDAPADERERRAAEHRAVVRDMLDATGIG